MQYEAATRIQGHKDSLRHMTHKTDNTRSPGILRYDFLRTGTMCLICLICLVVVLKVLISKPRWWRWAEVSVNRGLADEKDLGCGLVVVLQQSARPRYQRHTLACLTPLGTRNPRLYHTSFLFNRLNLELLPRLP